MNTQNYRNHVKYYPLHHFIFYPLGTALLIFLLRMAFDQAENKWIWLSVAATVMLLLVLSFMTRQHYALSNQNRIVRLEMRFRYFVVTGKRFEPLEARLSFGQIAALRFASDEELPALTDRAIAENLKPDAIKRSIKNWLPDTMRV